jgi:hydrogenase expression/formation protein HypC
MCVGVPLQIHSIDGLEALAIGADGLSRVDLSLVGRVNVGVHVLTHLGVAVRVLDAEEAAQIANALEAVRLAARGESFEHLLADLIDREPELPAHLRAQHDQAEEADERAVGLRRMGN